MPTWCFQSVVVAAAGIAASTNAPGFFLEVKYAVACDASR